MRLTFTKRLSSSVLLIAVILFTACSSDTQPMPAERGERLFRTEGCSDCHSTGTGTVVGPGLAGIGEAAATRRPGLTAHEYLRESITAPGEFLVDGFPDSMPNYSGLDSQRVDDLIAYLKTLQ